MGKILGIDYGKKRIGIAISDPLKLIAVPLVTIEAKKTLSETAQEIFTILLPYRKELEKIVIGLPLLLDGKEGTMAQETKDFAKCIQERFSLDVVFADERLSSKQAEKELLYLSRKKRTGKIDTIAATVVLQGYLDSLSK